MKFNTAFPPLALRAFCTVKVYQQIIPMNRRQHCHFILAGILADPLARGL